MNSVRGRTRHAPPRARRQAVLNAARLDALVGDLIDDENADPNILGQQQTAIERSLRRAAASLETLPGPPRWRELSVAWRRVAMILVHKGEFTAAEAPLKKARDAAGRVAPAQPSPASRRNALLVKLCRTSPRASEGREAEWIPAGA